MRHNNKNYKKGLNIVIIISAALTVCGFINYALGISNPAAVYCDKLGYQQIIKETEDGRHKFICHIIKPK